MKLLFGLDLFKFGKEPETQLYDFAQHGIIKATSDFYGIADLVRVETEADLEKKRKRGRPKKKEEPEILITPKGLYQMKALNDNEFAIKVDPEYIEKNIEDCELKLELMYDGKKPRRGEPQSLSSANGYGKREIKSIIERLKNREKIDKVKNVVDKYPHTTSLLLNQVLENHKNLKFRKAEDFIPDLPVGATRSMKEYNDMCQKLCKKDTHFYIIAEQKDFERVQKRRDPILLAQSPFGFFWQVLGAWADEVKYIGDL